MVNMMTPVLKEHSNKGNWELLVNGEPRSGSDSVYCSSLVLTRCFLCVSMRDFNRVLICQKLPEDRIMQEF